MIFVLTWTPVASAAGGCPLGIPCDAGHPIAFAILGAPLAGVFATSRLARRSPRRALVMVFLALWITASVDELVQPSVGRDASLQDWALDLVGGMTSFLGSSAVLRVLSERLGWFASEAQAPNAPAAAVIEAPLEPASRDRRGPRGSRRRRR